MNCLNYRGRFQISHGPNEISYWLLYHLFRISFQFYILYNVILVYSFGKPLFVKLSINQSVKSDASNTTSSFNLFIRMFIISFSTFHLTFASPMSAAAASVWKCWVFNLEHEVVKQQHSSVISADHVENGVVDKTSSNWSSTWVWRIFHIFSQVSWACAQNVIIQKHQELCVCDVLL